MYLVAFCNYYSRYSEMKIIEFTIVNTDTKSKEHYAENFL